MNVQDIVDFLRERELTLVTAESCTAGLIASTIADVKGAGDLLDCAFVTYSPSAKQKCLGVKPETISRFNLTSEQVAREMALGALRCSSANLAVANTGVTDGVDPRVAPGTQCYAWAFAARTGEPTVFSETRRFEGDRNHVRQQSALYALERIPDLFRQSTIGR
ncbi:MAG TPA: CinA family protein [Burkholderiaceae bacterium]|jgi:PncC family amidohydrolase